jgi:RNA recognition motif-containing protein
MQPKKGTELDGRMMNIDDSKKKDNREKQETRGQRYGDQWSNSPDTLFLRNLYFEAIGDDIHNLLAPFCTATSVCILTNPEDSSMEGFGYITFGAVGEAKSALEGAQGSFINNRPVRMDLATSGGSEPGAVVVSGQIRPPQRRFRRQ